MTSQTPVPRVGRTPLHFGYRYSAGGAHPAGWRHPGGAHDPFDPAQVTQVARKAEAIGLDFIHFGDRLRPDIAGGHGHPDALARTEAFTTASFLATRTRTIGFVVTANASYFEPFNLARLTASLDHVTHGRAGWAIATGATSPAAQNYSLSEASDDAHRERAAEVVHILRNLWDSWEDDAFVRNKQTGEYVDGSKIRAIHHQGALFNIKGPLNVARPPQGQLVIAQSVEDDGDVALAAREADIVFLAGDDVERLAARVRLIRERATEHGRDPDGLTIFAEVTPLLAPSSQDAHALYDTLNGLITLDPVRGDRPDLQAVDADAPSHGQPGTRNLASLSRRVGVDLTGLKLQQPLDASIAAQLNDDGQALLNSAGARTGRAIGADLPLIVADLLYAHIVPGLYLVGDGNGVADGIEALVAATGVDGIILQSAFVPDQLSATADLLAPVLRERGLLIDRPGPTLRARLALDAPVNRLVAA